MLANPQNLHPIFSQEQLTTLLCTTHLYKVMLHAAPLVDISIPLINSATLLEDIKSTYTTNPVTIWELDHCLNGNSSP